MKRLTVVLAVLAVLGAAAITAFAQPRPLDERLVDIQVGALMPELADALHDEPMAMKQVMLAYADEPLLLLKAKAAYLRYPHLAREVFPIYGHEPEFRAILANYGEQVLLPVSYFLHNEVRTVSAKHAAGHGYRSAVHASREVFAERGSERPDAPVFHALTEVDRGWYAVNYARDEGYNFIGQFVVDRAGQPQWVQTERFTEGFMAFFTRGIRDLETTSRVGDDVTGTHVAWAAVDAVVFVGALKLAGMGRNAAVGSRAAAGTRTAGVRTTGSVARTAQAMGLPRLALYGAIAYTVIAHPSLISDALSMLARWLGWPEWLVLAGGWSLILFPLLLVAMVVGRLLVRPVFRLTMRA